MAQIQIVDLCYIQGNAGTAIFTVFFLAHLTSSSYRCFLAADKQSVCGGFSQYGWAFRNRPEASLTAGKINLVPGRSERPGRSCLLVPQSSEVSCPTERGGLSNYKASSSLSYCQKISPQGVFVLHFCPLHKPFSSSSRYLPPYQKLLYSSNYMNLSSSQC